MVFSSTELEITLILANFKSHFQFFYSTHILGQILEFQIKEVLYKHIFSVNLQIGYNFEQLRTNWALQYLTYTNSLEKQRYWYLSYANFKYQILHASAIFCMKYFLVRIKNLPCTLMICFITLIKGVLCLWAKINNLSNNRCFVVWCKSAWIFTIWTFNFKFLCYSDKLCRIKWQSVF